jgi:hypothetical protein
VKKRLLYLLAAALVGMLILVPSAFAQGEVMTEATIEQTTEAPVLPKSGGGPVGGPAVVLPAAAGLLVGSGVLAYAAMRARRR